MTPGYLGADTSKWSQYDACALMKVNILLRYLLRTVRERAAIGVVIGDVLSRHVALSTCQLCDAVWLYGRTQ